MEGLAKTTQPRGFSLAICVIFGDYFKYNLAKKTVFLYNL